VAFEPPASWDIATTPFEAPAPPPAVEVPTPDFSVVPESPGVFDVAPAPGEGLAAPAAPSLPGDRAQDAGFFAPPVATAQSLGRPRSVRDNVILGVLLMNALLFVGWQARRRQQAEGRSRVTIYDLPPGGPVSSEAS
jgi:hypothetical protein